LNHSPAPMRPQIFNLHPSSCPAYVLHSGLQGGGKRPNKGVRRSRVALYLGSLSHHARSIALVLSLMTGYVSPHFHLKYDDFFETVQETKSLPQSKWQQLGRFITATGAPLKEPTRTKATRAWQTTTTHPRVVPDEDPFGFDFVDLGNADGKPTTQDPELEDPPPLIPREHSFPEELQDPEGHCHPDSTC
jgi:hypothetical protein